MRRVFEGFIYFGVHLDHKVPCFYELIVSVIDLRVNPVLEILTNDGIEYVSQPLPREFWEVTFIRQIILHFRVERSLVEYCLNSELIVLRNEDDLYLIALDLFLLPSYEVPAHKLALIDVNLLEEVDRDGLIRTEIGLGTNR